MIPDAITYEIVEELPSEDVIALYQEGGWWVETEKHRQAIPKIIQGSFCFMVARYKGKAIAMGRVISDGVSDGYIQDVIVLKEFRGLRVGSEIVRQLTQFCIKHGLEWIGLIAEPNTASFYKNLGFHSLKNYQPLFFQKESLS